MRVISENERTHSRAAGYPAMTRTIFTVAILIGLRTLVSAGGQADLDFSQLGVDRDRLALIEQYLPPDIKKSLLRSQVSPTGLRTLISWTSFVSTTTEAPQDKFAIYYSSGTGLGRVVILRRTGDLWTQEFASSLVPGGGWAMLEVRDVDCDGENDIIVSSTSATGNESLIVLRQRQSIWQPLLSPQATPFFGRVIELVDRDGDCRLEIEVTTDGPVKYQLELKSIFRLDPLSKTYRLIDEAKLESSDRK